MTRWVGTEDGTDDGAWWEQFHVPEMADLFLARNDQELATTLDFLRRELRLEPGSRAYDQCCGIGSLSIALASQGIRMTGADLCEFFIERARGDAERAEVTCQFHCADAFGWQASQWRAMAAEVDTVIHCAAEVDLLRSYEELRETNVAGIAEVVRFTHAGSVKHLHYASSLSVFVATDRSQGTMYEDDDLSQTNRVYGGYAQTKWAAEVLLRESGVPADRLTIFR